MADTDPAFERVRRWGAVAAVHLALTYAATFPSAHHVFTSFFGTVRGDKYQFVWVFWWVRRSLVELGELPFWTSLQYHPTGVSLTLHDMTYFWSLLSVPLQLFMSPEAVLNVFLLASIPLNGVAFYALARHVSGSHWGALAGSIVFAYCPYLLGRFAVSHPQYLGVFFVPLFLLCLSRYSRDGHLRDLVWAGVCAGLTSLISFYYGIALAVLFAAFLISQNLPGHRQDVASAGIWVRLLSQLAATGIPAAALTLPVLLPGLIEIASGTFGNRIGGSSLERGSADLVAYLLPDHGLVEWRGWALVEELDAWATGVMAAVHGNIQERSVYPGWISWGAALAAIASRPLRRRAWPWLAVAGGAMLITLGPTLYIAGTPYLDGWMPARWLQSIPLMNIVRGPSRFAVFVTLGTGMVIALAIAEIGARRGSRWACATAVGCMLFAALEFAPRETFVFDQSDSLSPFYHRMAADAEEYVVLNVPVDFRGALGGGDLYSYAQTIHQKPIVGGYVSREPTYVFKTLGESPFLQAVLHRGYSKEHRLALSPAGLEDMPRALERLGVRYLLVHRTELDRQDWGRVTRWLERGPLREVYQGSQLRAYEVVQKPAQPAP